VDPLAHADFSLCVAHVFQQTAHVSTHTPHFSHILPCATHSAADYQHQCVNVDADMRGGERTRENARARGCRCETKVVNAQSISLAAADGCQLIMQKSCSQPDGHTRVDGH
jgi:hypothetical protein